LGIKGNLGCFSGIESAAAGWITLAPAAGLDAAARDFARDFARLSEGGRVACCRCRCQGRGGHQGVASWCFWLSYL
jgi:hypothetical protein